MYALLAFVASFVMVFFITLIFAGIALGVMAALSHLIELLVMPGTDSSVEKVRQEDRPS